MSVGFLALSAITILGAIGVLFNRNAVYAALFLILHMLGIAGLYALLDAHFLAVVQIIVYAGAIIVLVVFVLMLLNVKVEEKDRKIVTGSLALLSFGGLYLLFNEYLVPVVGSVSTLQGTTKILGKEIFTHYILPFEAASVLLIAALVGAVMMAKRGGTK